MVSHPETGSDSPIGSERDRGRDTNCDKTCPQLAYNKPCNGLIYTSTSQAKPLEHTI